ncbi:hypothetical protein AAF712_012197 [Marasmius tenuissimus]|uniref:Uncharacterized protein n=1 Tax=Marasmius tenuissimus TaxID=585030 RepID=A0ABR2ZID0_9AGAR
MPWVLQACTGTPTTTPLACNLMSQSSLPKPQCKASVFKAPLLSTPAHENMPQHVHRASAPPVAHPLLANPVHNIPRHVCRASASAILTARSSSSLPVHKPRGFAEYPSTNQPAHKAVETQTQTSSKASPTLGNPAEINLHGPSKNQVRVKVLEPIVEEAEEPKAEEPKPPCKPIAGKQEKEILVFRRSGCNTRELSPIDIFAVPEGKSHEAWKTSLMKWYGNNANKYTQVNKSGLQTKPKREPKSQVQNQVTGQAQDKDNFPAYKSLVQFFNKLTGNALTVVTGRELFGEAHAQLIAQTVWESNKFNQERVIKKLWDCLEMELKDYWNKKALEDVSVAS